MKYKNIFMTLFSFIFISSSVFANEVTSDRLKNADSEPQNWLTHHQNLEGYRFTDLNEINRFNVKNLKVAHTIPLGDIAEGSGGLGNHQSTPLVKDGMMYVTGMWNVVYKYDLTGKHPMLLWKFDPESDPDIMGSPVTRGAALYGTAVIINTDDNRVISIDDATGEMNWETQVVSGQYDRLRAAPLVMDDVIMVSNTSGDQGARGWVAGFSPVDGAELWRFWTVPKPGEPGSETWTDADQVAWRTGGAALWVTGMYDVESKQYLVGTGNPSPMFDPEYRPGDNLYSNALLAIDSQTGNLDWYFQYTPGDYLDYDEVGGHIIVDAMYDGEMRKQVGHFGRNGFYYQLDRTNGQFLKAEAYLDNIDWVEGIDPKTGLPLGYKSGQVLQEYIAGGAPRRGGGPIGMCPHLQGGVNMWPTAYNPKTGMHYGAGMEGCSEVEAIVTVADEIDLVDGKVFLGGSLSSTGRIEGSITAYNIKTAEVAGKYMHPAANYAGVVATGGGLVCTGWVDGYVTCHDDKSLDKLWEFYTGTNIKAPPISYSVNGKQYIAILAGGTTSAGWLNLPETEGLQFASTLYIFSL
jgi:alcohol dehydrogenase (cytochrome c)